MARLQIRGKTRSIRDDLLIHGNDDIPDDNTSHVGCLTERTKLPELKKQTPNGAETVRCARSRNPTAKTCDIVSATAGNRQRKRKVYVIHLIGSFRRTRGAGALF